MKKCSIAFAILLIIATQAEAARWYISPTGNDTGGNGSRSNPYATLHRVTHVISDLVGAAGSSDTIIVLEGTYNWGQNGTTFIGYDAWVRGKNHLHPLVIMGDPASVAAGRKPVIGGYVSADHGLLSFQEYYRSTGGVDGIPCPATDDIQYIVIKDIKFDNFGLFAMHIHDGGYDCSRHDTSYANSVTIEGCEFTNGVYRHGLKMSGCDSFVVRDCYFANFPNNCIDMVGCHKNRIYDNEFVNWGISSGGTAIMNKGGSANNVIERNVFRESSTYGVLLGQETGEEYTRPMIGDIDEDGQVMDYESKNIMVYRNIFINVGVPITWSCSRGGKVYNNTFYCGRNYGQPGGIKAVARIHEDHQNWTVPPVPCREGEFKNNIAYFGTPYPPSGAVWIQSSTTAPETFTFSNNLWYRVTDPSKSIPDWSYLAANYGSPQHVNDFVGDPQFAGSTPSSPADFIPKPGSPAIAVGLPLSQVLYDFFNRPYVNPNRTLGAFEVQEHGAPPTPPPLIDIRPR